ncbi:hypothetical protein [Lactiplantibacillus modestisalitolerans]|uniref:Integral membrane protein n=1 Tax=Lactiplantibacillus modestisalitolerans TaxID=1457219 RepID=A0ABV5WV61_9LACO|nr:hypothetical protein [Lactiplantibacillus modestisalitolerans]
MQRQLSRRQRWLIMIGLTLIGFSCALLGKWGRLVCVLLAGLTLALLTNSCLLFCHRRGFTLGSGMLFSLVVALSYLGLILGSYGYLRG